VCVDEAAVEFTVTILCTCW